MLCFVVAVSAGDALSLMCSDLGPGSAQQARTINLRAIAAPEDDQPFAVESRLHLESMCAGAPITVTLQGSGRDGDTVADVQCRHVDAATEQVRTGLAWHDEAHGGDLTHLRAAQTEAVSAGREIWATSRPIPPWRWKKGRRPGTTAAAATASAASAGAQGSRGCPQPTGE